MQRTILFLLALAVISCSPISKKSLTKTFRETENKFQDHTGFVLYDLDKKKTVFEYNGAAYFTPASNTKIFTFYTCLNILGDSVPALRYVEQNDSLIFWGTGDPSLLYKNVFQNNRVVEFLKSASLPIYFSPSNFYTTHFGTGWAWDDYKTAYSPERSPFPMYGNIFSAITTLEPVVIKPAYFQRFMNPGELRRRPQIEREAFSNTFKFHPSTAIRVTEIDAPFTVTSELTTELLADTLLRQVGLVHKALPPDAKTFYSIPTDSLYRVMMQDSDNFIAEQVLVMCASILSDSLQPEIAIRYAKKILLADMSDEPAWVDGSGLSRYNLFTPRSIVQLWEKIYEKVPREQLFPLLATGGKAGTIRSWYKADQPYIFGKTGTLSNNHSLSGYLVTKKGKTYIFSFMNSNYVVPTNDIRKNMQAILQAIYEQR